MTKTAAKSEKKAVEIPRGRPKTGLVWKNTKSKRSSSMIDVKPWRKSWEKHQKERYDRKKLKAMEAEMKEKAKAEKVAKRLRIEENRKRREENLKKSEVVQTITNAAKLKRLKKKQLRNIEKR